MICPECKIDFKPTRANQRFCCRAHKDAFHNKEKSEAITVSECFRPATQEYSTAWGKTMREAADIIYALGLKWTEQGKVIPDIYGMDEKKEGEK